MLVHLCVSLLLSRFLTRGAAVVWDGRVVWCRVAQHCLPQLQCCLSTACFGVAASVLVRPLQQASVFFIGELGFALCLRWCFLVVLTADTVVCWLLLSIPTSKQRSRLSNDEEESMPKQMKAKNANKVKDWRLLYATQEESTQHEIKPRSNSCNGGNTAVPDETCVAGNCCVESYESRNDAPGNKQQLELPVFLSFPWH